MSAVPDPPTLADARAFVASKAHPEADRYPMMDDARLQELADDIAAHGQNRAIQIHEGLCLDGRNRWVACLIRGQEPRFEVWRGKGDPADFADSENLHRRDLDPSQRAMIVAKRSDVWTAAQGAARDRRAFGSRHTPITTGRKVASDAAAMANVSTRTMENAIAVRDGGAPELVVAVTHGKVPASVAADLARAPVAQQQKLVQALEEGLADPDPAVRKQTERIIRTKATEIRQGTATKKRVARERAIVAAAPAAATPGVEVRLGRVADVLPTLPRDYAHLVTADPGWEYTNGGNGTAKGRYDTMDVEDVVTDLAAAYDVAAPDAYLLMWVTHPFDEAWHEGVAAAKTGLHPLWRWQYATGGSWGKVTAEGAIATGTGVHARGASELWKLYTKGRPKPFALLRNHHTSERTEHSEKPLGYVTDLVRAYCPAGGQVLTLYAGRAPEARAALATRRRCLAIESVPLRHKEALGLLCPPTPLLAAATP